ncbi:tetratricopeptide repeat protein [Sphingobacteriales bacterium UPWRP_1]|nr:hypothetical protein B6N25_00240 [Sphingobacteriales bacterium TSM_CSS]PSJ71645.1 tetratricopeptide repeat protein [Sphingobacteriales bacterium UPWRP_1]
MVAFAIEYQFFGYNPAVSHLISVLLYVLTVLVIFFMFREALGNRYHPVLPFVIAFLFAVHPLHSEVVNNVKSRDELLSFLLGLLCLWSFLKYAWHEKFAYIFSGIVLGVLAPLAKETIIVFSALIPMSVYFLSDYRPLPHLKQTKEQWLLNIVALALIACVVISVRGYYWALLQMDVYFYLFALFLFYITYALGAGKLKPESAMLLETAFFALLGVGLGLAVFETLGLGKYLIILFLLGLLFFTATSRISIIVATFACLVTIQFLIDPILYDKKPGVGLVETNRVIELYENPLFFQPELTYKIGLGFKSLLFYLKMLFIPYPLCYYYGYNQISVTEWYSPVSLLSMLIYALLAGYALYLLPRKNLVSYGILFYLAAISMYSNIIQPAPGIVAERFAYVGSLGFCVAMAVLLFRAIAFVRKNNEANKQQPVTPQLALALLMVGLVCFACIVPRNANWKNVFTLYQADVGKVPNSAKVNFMYAASKIKEFYEYKKEYPGIYDLCIKHLNKALEIYPRYVSAWNNLGFVYMYTGEREKAISCLKKAIEYKPTHSEALFNIGLAFDQLGKTDSAIYYYKRVLEVDTAKMVTQAYDNLTNIYLNQSKLDEALDMLEVGLLRHPQSLALYDNIAKVYYAIEDYENALAMWEKALAIKPDNKATIYKLYNAYQSVGNEEKASYYQKMLLSMAQIAPNTDTTGISQGAIPILFK